MKNILLLLLLIIFSPVAFAANNAVIPLNVGIGTSQTTTSAMTVMKGNVGIGTWAPGMSLDINGTMRATAFVGNGAALTNILWTNSAGQLYPSLVNENLGVGTTTPQGSLVVINGNVGIGTWAPNRQLSIVQSGSFASLGLTRTGQREYDLLVGNSQAASFEVYDNSGGGSRLLIDSNGNVGIGTTAPQGALTVMNGKVGIGTWAPTGALVVMNGNVGIGTAPQVPLHVLTSGTEALRIQTTGNNVYLNGFDSSDPVNVHTELMSSSSGTLYMGGYASNPIYFRNNGYTIRLAIDQNGNVGIGSGTPTSSNMLSVVGNIGIGTVSSSAFVNNSAPSGGMIVENNVGIGTVNPQSMLDVTNGNVGIGTWAPGGALVVQNGNVGIGTNAPQTSLAVQGAVGIGTWAVPSGNALTVMNGNMGIGTYAVSNRLVMSTANNQGIELQGPSGETLSIEDINSGANHFFAFMPGAVNNLGTMILNRSSRDWIGVWIRNTGGNYNALYMDNVDNYMDFSTSITNPISLQPTSGGNVGIGTSVPNNKLTVVGNFGIGNAIASKYVSSSAPAGGLIAEGNVGIGSTTPQAGLVVNGGNVGIGTWSAAGGNLIVNGVGNVGVASAWPGQTVDVQGTARVKGLTISGQSPANGKVLSASDSNGDLYWLASPSSGGWAQLGNSIYSTATGAQVGVGTTTPQGALVVSNGNMSIGTWGTINTMDLNGNSSVGAYTGINAATSGGMIVSGNVGIGTFAPAGLLQVGSSVGGNGTRPANGGSIVIPTNGVNDPPTSVSTGIEFVSVDQNWGSRIVNTDLLNGNVPLLFQGRFNTAVWHNAMAVGVNGTNVGVGTFGAQSMLTISGNEAIGSAVAGGFSPSNGLTVQGDVGIGTATPQDGFIVTNGNVGIGTWASNGALIVQQGNVGIGTWNTTAPFDVANTATQLIIRDGGISNPVSFFQTAGSTFTITNSNSLVFTMNQTSNLTYYNFATAPSGSGISRMRIDNTGNVGLGIGGFNTLYNSLSVVGNIGIGTNQSSSFVQTPAPNGGMIVQGNVGIGSVNPGQVLDVVGTLRVTGLTMTGQTPANGKVLTANDSAGDAYWSSVGSSSLWTQSASNVYLTATTNNIGLGTTTPQGSLVILNGNVGIGTWAPVAILDIGPNNAANDYITMAGYRAWFGYDAAGSNGNLALSGGTLKGMEFFENGTSGTFLSGTNAQYFDRSGNVGMGTSTPVGSLVVMNGNVGIGTWTGKGGALIVNGRMGIGVNNPVYSFMVSSTASPQASFQSTGSNNAAMTINDTVGGYQTMIQLLDAGSLKYQIGKQIGNSYFFMYSAFAPTNNFIYENSAGLFLLPTVGNLGITTTNPGQSLDVAGTVRVIGANGVYFGNDTRSDIQASASIAPDIQFLTNNTEQMRVTNGGNLGIATNTPNAMLDVRGSIDLGPTTNGSNAFQQRFTSDGSGSNARVLDACATFFQSGNAKSNLSCGGTESLSHFALNNNLLGIGTWVPTSTLSIGTTNAASGIGIGATYNSTYVTTASSQPGGINAEGNVGIGTTTPQAAMIILKNNVGIGTWAAQGGSLIVNGGGDVGIGSIAPQAQLDLGTSSKPLVLPGLKAITGTRFLCISATGQLSSSPSPCSGT